MKHALIIYSATALNLAQADAFFVPKSIRLRQVMCGSIIHVTIALATFSTSVLKKWVSVIHENL